MLESVHISSRSSLKISRTSTITIMPTLIWKWKRITQLPVKSSHLQLRKQDAAPGHTYQHDLAARNSLFREIEATSTTIRIAEMTKNVTSVSSDDDTTSPHEAEAHATANHDGILASRNSDERKELPGRKRSADEELSSERSRKKGTYGTLCNNSEEATNVAGDGGVCHSITHGAKKECKADGCTNWAHQVGAVCIRHRPKRKLCSSHGCTNQAKRGGVCRRHGARVDLCSSDGCTNQAREGGVCRRHGAKINLCSVEGCTTHAKGGGVCVRHGGHCKVKLCSRKGCTSQAKRGGVCRRHEAKASD